jgi:hypothetical protein
VGRECSVWASPQVKRIALRSDTSGTDPASARRLRLGDYGSEGWGFEFSRAHQEAHLRR